MDTYKRISHQSDNILQSFFLKHIKFYSDKYAPLTPIIEESLLQLQRSLGKKTISMEKHQKIILLREYEKIL